MAKKKSTKKDEKKTSAKKGDKKKESKQAEKKKETKSEKDKTRFNTAEKPNWCPGCGNFGMQQALKKALIELDMDEHDVVLVSGIGCSGKIPQWVHVNGFQGLHGRAVPPAQAVKLANHNLVVIAEGGDGDGYSEGMNHFIQAARRNIDFTYIVHNNGVFALTTGQAATTARRGFVTPTTPHGVVEPPFMPAALAIVSGATFVARGYCGDVEHLKDLYVAAIRHRGFALVDVLQICVTYNPTRGYKWFSERVYKLEEEDDHDPTDKNRALQLALGAGQRDDDRLATGIFYQVEDVEILRDALPQLEAGPLVEQDIGKISVDHLMKELI